MTLHIVNLSPDEANNCFEQLAEGDCVVFYGKGRQCAHQNNSQAQTIIRLNNTKACRFYLLRNDESQQEIVVMLPDVAPIDYPEFVQLAIGHDKSVSWF